MRPAGRMYDGLPNDLVDVASGSGIEGLAREFQDGKVGGTMS